MERKVNGICSVFTRIGTQGDINWQTMTYDIERRFHKLKKDK